MRGGGGPTWNTRSSIAQMRDVPLPQIGRSYRGRATRPARTAMARRGAFGTRAKSLARGRTNPYAWFYRGLNIFGKTKTNGLADGWCRSRAVFVLCARLHGALPHWRRARESDRASVRPGRAEGGGVGRTLLRAAPRRNSANRGASTCFSHGSLPTIWRARGSQPGQSQTLRFAKTPEI